MTYNQIALMLCRSKTEVIFLLSRLIKIYCKRKKDLHMVFIDIEKAYNRVPQRVLWRVIVKKEIHIKYTNIIKNIYEGVVTSVKTIVEYIKEFPIIVGLQ